MNGYPEVFAFGGLTLWLATRLRGRLRAGEDGTWLWVVFGAAAGFGVFAREMRRADRSFSREAIGEFDLYVPERHVDPGELALLRRF